MARPSKPLISREGAVEAALAVIDDVGLDAFSLARVAQHIGVQTPSLYHHFSDRAELLSEVVRYLFRSIAPIRPRKNDFESVLEELCVATRRQLLEHPHAASLVLQFFPRDVVLAAYEQTAVQIPYPAAYHLAIFEAIEKFVFGSTLFAAAAKIRNAGSLASADLARFPALKKGVAKNKFDDERLFRESVRLLLDGMAARYKSKS